MAVHFDFILSDQDAENLMDMLKNEKVRMLENAMEAYTQGEDKKRQFYKKAAKYVDEIKDKMTNYKESVKKKTTSKKDRV